MKVVVLENYLDSKAEEFGLDRSIEVGFQLQFRPPKPFLTKCVLPGGPRWENQDTCSTGVDEGMMMGSFPLSLAKIIGRNSYIAKNELSSSLSGSIRLVRGGLAYCRILEYGAFLRTKSKIQK